MNTAKMRKAVTRDNTVNVDWRSLSPEMKVEIIESMGFVASFDPHQPDCLAPGSGLRCNCVPDATVWSPPHDVMALRGETWPERLAKSRLRFERVVNGRTVTVDGFGRRAE